MSLIHAILAMDSYHRNHPGGLLDIIYGSNDKAQTINIDGFSQIRTSRPELARDFGFSATAYARGSETVIAYRGTDDGGVRIPPIDSYYGYGFAVGVSETTQSRLAVQFYKDVLAQSVGPAATVFDGSIVLTGHSLGGGLAGYIGALYGKLSHVYNYLDFDNSAKAAYERSVVTYVGAAPIART